MTFIQQDQKYFDRSVNLNWSARKKAERRDAENYTAAKEACLPALREAIVFRHLLFPLRDSCVNGRHGRNQISSISSSPSSARRVFPSPPPLTSAPILVFSLPRHQTRLTHLKRVSKISFPLKVLFQKLDPIRAEISAFYRNEGRKKYSIGIGAEHDRRIFKFLVLLNYCYCYETRASTFSFFFFFPIRIGGARNEAHISRNWPHKPGRDSNDRETSQPFFYGVGWFETAQFRADKSARFYWFLARSKPRLDTRH